MRKLYLPAVLALAALASVPAQAQVSDNFDVIVTLTSACRLTTAPGDITIGYTSFTVTPVSATTDFAVQCTNTLPYSMALNTANADTLGLLIPLSIRDSADTTNVTGTQTAGAAATSYKIRADIAAGQQGTCATATCTSTVTRTLTITY